MSGAAIPADHRVHGMGSALEAPTWPAITAPEAEAILALFPSAGRMVGLRWHSPRPFSAATLVHTSRGEFFLKRHHCRLRTPDGLREEHGFIAHLHAAGVAVPEIMTTADGRGAVQAGAWTYELHRKAPGADLYRDRPSWTPFLLRGHAQAAGAALARLHRAACGFAAPARRVQPLVASWTILPAADPLAAAEAFIAARPALAGFLAGKPWRHDLARLLGTRGEGLPPQPALWTHNDWHPSNLLWTAEGEVRTVFDFGLADRTCALHDLALAIERSAIQWLRLGQGDDAAITDAAAASALLAGYADILPLGAAERETLVRLLPVVHLEFALSEVDYFAGILSDAANATIAWEDYLIGHAAWFGSAPGRDFLAQIAQGG